MMNTFHDIKYRAMCQSDLEKESYLLSVSELIYDTDPYIYPALFDSLEKATEIIPQMIVSNDAMFSYKNMFIALENNEIVGLILWHLGPLIWNENILLKSSDTIGVMRPKSLSIVKENYFDSYSYIHDDTISVINVCVRKDKRNQGIAQELLKAFIDDTKNDCLSYELFVLANNFPAIRVYKKLGFEIESRLQGFSIEKRDLPCLRMIRVN